MRKRDKFIHRWKNNVLITRGDRFLRARLGIGDPEIGDEGHGVCFSHKIFTARAARIAIAVSEIDDCSIISTFAHRESTGTSVGENAVLVLNARNR